MRNIKTSARNICGYQDFSVLGLKFCEASQTFVLGHLSVQRYGGKTKTPQH